MGTVLAVAGTGDLTGCDSGYPVHNCITVMSTMLIN